MVANSNQNQTPNTKNFENPTPTAENRTYPGLNRLEFVQNSIQKSVLDATWENFGGDGASEPFSTGNQNDYAVFFKPSTSESTANGWVQRQFAEFETEQKQDKIRTEAFESQEDLVEDLLQKHYQNTELDVSQPVFIFEPDFQKAAELSRRLSGLGQQTHLASTFSNWANVLGRLGCGLVDVIVSTTLEVPLANQIPWSTVYVPSVQCLRASSDPEGWIGKLILAQESTNESFEVVVG